MKRTMLAGCENIREICIPKDSAGLFKKVRRDFDDRVIEKGTPSAATAEPKPKKKEKEKTKDKDKAKAKEKNKDKHKQEDMTEKRKSPMYR